jgi:hypothetical protein
MNFLANIACLLLLAPSTIVSAEPVLKAGGVLVAPAHSNGFQGIPNNTIFYTGGSAPYAEGGITVTQYQGDPGNDIFVTLNPAPGALSWYPNGGDHGYTGIALTSGGDFKDLSLDFVSWGTGSLQYSILNDGVEVLGGFYTTAANLQASASIIGGGFDQVLIRSGYSGTIGDGNLNALQIDNIHANSQLAVDLPEPSSLALLSLALIGFGAARRKRSL